MIYLPKPHRRPKPDFSLTIVNIVFLLLLFYLATGSLIKRSEVEADIPVTRDLPLERLPRPLLLAAGGELFLDGRAIARTEAAAEAHAAIEVLPPTAFLNILVERSMLAGEFLDIVAAIQEVGVPVRVVTLRERLSGEAGP